jgi:hypothetical protein
MPEPSPQKGTVNLPIGARRRDPEQGIMRSYERALRLSDHLRSVAAWGVLKRWWSCVTDDDRGHT